MKAEFIERSIFIDKSDAVAFVNFLDEEVVPNLKKKYKKQSKEYVFKSVIVMPEWNISVDDIFKIDQQKCFGICSDYVKKIN